MSRHDAVTATRRFGLGARPGQVSAISGDPRGYLLAQLEQPGASLIRDPDLRPGHEALAAFYEARLADREQRKSTAVTPSPSPGKAQNTPAAMAPPEAPGPMTAMTELPGPMIAPDAQAQGKRGPRAAKAKSDPSQRAELRREVWQAEIEARVRHAATTENALVERLVMFWSNHFAVAVRKGGPVRVTAGAFEREAIRPHVLGRFLDMLMAVEKHPAMLIYLDNNASVGPNSRAGQRQRKGLNENLARELLELHTVGVDAGYTQTDVTNLARILTGWTVPGIKQTRFEAGKFAFTPARHEPGEWQVLSKTYPDRGLETGEQVLADLARHPATARHIARKLAAHFVASPPPPELVASLEATFRDTGGDLRQLTRTLLTHDAAWQSPPRKLLPPYDFLLAAVRGLEARLEPRVAARLSAALGQPIWNPPSPKGWPEDDDVWMAPSSIRERLRIAGQLAPPAAASGDPTARARDLFGTAISAKEIEAISRAESRLQGTEILIMSPSFQRR